MQRRSRAGRALPPINEQTLQELHRGGVLVPLFRVDLTLRPDASAIDISASLTAKHVFTTHINELFRAAAEGRASDPTAVGFEPWPMERRRALWPSVETGYLYSRHQLLATLPWRTSCLCLTVTAGQPQPGKQIVTNSETGGSGPDHRA